MHAREPVKYYLCMLVTNQGIELLINYFKFKLVKKKYPTLKKKSRSLGKIWLLNLVK